MYKSLTIGGEDYKLEYTIEASLYADCVSSVAAFLTDLQESGEKNDAKKLLSGIANIPQTALTIFYAGLMEYHGTHPDGDGKVPDIHAAKRLIAQYLKEHEDDENGNFYAIMQMCIDQMGEDGFFKRTGMEQMMNSMTEEPKKQKKVPQDHKKPSAK